LGVLYTGWGWLGGVDVAYQAACVDWDVHLEVLCACGLIAVFVERAT
jgi:hypothetical protein